MPPRWVGLLVAGGLWLGLAQQPASAALVSFDMLDHPATATWDSGALGMGIFPPGYGYNGFHFVDVHFVIDDVTGLATAQGNIIHNPSGQPWRLSASFQSIASTGTWPTQDHVPYNANAMLEDLQNAGFNTENRLGWGLPSAATQVSVQIETDILHPAYAGPRQFVGEGAMGFPFYLRFRYGLGAGLPGDPFAGPAFDLIGGAGWFREAGSADHGGDFLFVLKRSTSPVIPEPATGVLLGLGLLAGVVRKRSNARV